MNSVGGHGESASLANDALEKRLGQRYEVIRALGGDGWGRTYLAQDHQRDRDLCVVKEFVPPVADEAMLAKAKALFEHEANVLYQLDHPQIPKFRQMPQAASAESLGDHLEDPLGDPLEDPLRDPLGDPLGKGSIASRSEPLYWVRDYIPGPNYQLLLEERQKFGGRFSETEITQLLYQLLPVLSYIHSKGILHQDISPKNLVLRQSDGLPVLMNFGGVQGGVERSAEGRLADSAGVDSSIVDSAISVVATPADDLYGLAATMLVLATGEAPEMLHDPHYGTWRGYESLSPKLGQILRRMLSPNFAERFPSANAVLSALQASEMSNEVPWDRAGGAMPGLADRGTGFASLYPPSGLGAAAVGVAGMAGTAYDTDYPEGYEADYEDGPTMSVTSPEVMPEVMATSMGYVDSAANESEVYESGQQISGGQRQPNASQALIGLLLTLGLVGTLLMLYALARGNRAPRASDTAQPVTVDEVRTLREGEYSIEETARKQAISSRREALGVSDSYFTNLVSELFYQDYPNLLTSGPNGGRKELTTAPADEPLRIRWDNIAMRLLEALESNFTSNSLGELGNYSESDRSRWQSLISSANVGDRALNDLVDAKFFRLFPDQAGRDFLAKPIGQLYYAIAQDRAQAINSGGVTETVSFASGSLSKDVSGRLDPGEGRIYLVQLSAGQLLRMNLTAPAESTQLSLYLPEPTADKSSVIADSEQMTWSGALPQTGVYELVITNHSTAAIDYQMRLSVDNVTSAPVAPPKKAAQPSVPSTNGTGNNGTGNNGTSTSGSGTSGSGNGSTTPTTPPASGTAPAVNVPSPQNGEASTPSTGQ